MGYELDKGAHSVYSLNYHYICCVKNRRKIFDTDEIINRLKEINISLAEKNDIKILNQETDLEHIHIILYSKRNQRPTLQNSSIR
ncbi:MAG: transposase [Promethearchaeia archaeon]